MDKKMFFYESRWVFLLLVCVAVVLSLTTWFSVTAVLPEIEGAYRMTRTSMSWLTNAVQIGFVVGALGSALTSLPDRIQVNLLMATCALLASIFNAIIVLEPNTFFLIVSRLLTGVALAGIYPPAIKLMATWFNNRRGLALGCLIGALTLGSALPHLVRAIGVGFDWRLVVVASSSLSVIAAGIFLWALREGPFPFVGAKVNLSKFASVIREKPVMLANAGYFGHMWELYAMWGWFLTYFSFSSFTESKSTGELSLITFGVISTGLIGAIVGGLVADRVGRCNTAAYSMIISGTCALIIGNFFDGPYWLFLFIASVWGASIISDSAQFSAVITEVADPSLVGSALAFQMGVGFCLTTVSIWAIPVLAEYIGGWQWVFVILVPGPLIGAICMFKLKHDPSSMRIANGKR